jgi:hypothetical protein
MEQTIQVTCHVVTLSAQVTQRNACFPCSLFSISHVVQLYLGLDTCLFSVSHDVYNFPTVSEL